MPRLNKIKSNISVAGKEGAMKTRSKTDFFIFMWGQSPCVDFWGGGKSHSCLGFTSLSLVINYFSLLNIIFYYKLKTNKTGNPVTCLCDLKKQHCVKSLSFFKKVHINHYPAGFCLANESKYCNRAYKPIMSLLNEVITAKIEYLIFRIRF